MNVEHLVRMANQIGSFFEAESDRAAAVAGVADHLRRFWDPQMRTAIVAHRRAGGAGLSEIVIEAIKELEPQRDEKRA